MRHLFDQYSQPENRLTHALVSALAQDQRLLRDFVTWLTGKSFSKKEKIYIVEQSIPGEEVLTEQESERRGLPDAWIYTNNGWALLIESKISAAVIDDQLIRHLRMAVRRGFKDHSLLVLSLREKIQDLPRNVLGITWCSVYEWLHLHFKSSEWAKRLAEYLEIAEAKMVEEKYLTEGTLTRFAGVPFNEDHPYNHIEAKRILGLIMNELKKKESIVKKLGADPSLPGRGAIKKDLSRVWDYIRLKESKGQPHTLCPHLTIGIHPDCLVVLVTLPNSVKPQIRKRIFSRGFEFFENTISKVANAMRKVLDIDPKVKPYLMVIQRHYLSQSSPPVEDAVIKYDLRTAIKIQPRSKEKFQPQWLRASYEVITNRKSNLQLVLGVEISFRDSRIINTPQAINLIEQSFLAFKPFLDVALDR